MFRASGTRRKQFRLEAVKPKVEAFRSKPRPHRTGLRLQLIRQISLRARCRRRRTVVLRSFAIVAALRRRSALARNCSMRKLVLGLLLAGVVRASASPPPAATMYISDQFTVPLRRGPSNSHRILHAGLPSGTALEVLGEDRRRGLHPGSHAERHRRLDPDAVPVRPTDRARSACGCRSPRRVARSAAEVCARLSAGARRAQQSEGRANDLAKQTEKLQAELAEIRRISATSIANYEENKQLKAEQRDAAEAGHATDRARAPAGAQRHAALDAGRRRPGAARIAARRLDQVATEAQHLGVSYESALTEWPRHVAARTNKRSRDEQRDPLIAGRRAGLRSPASHPPSSRTSARSRSRSRRSPATSTCWRAPAATSPRRSATTAS